MYNNKNNNNNNNKNNNIIIITTTYTVKRKIRFINYDYLLQAITNIS